MGATPHTGVEPCVRPDCSGFPAHRNNKTSRVGEDWPQIHCAGMSARSPGWQGGAVQAMKYIKYMKGGNPKGIFLDDVVK